MTTATPRLNPIDRWMFEEFRVDLRGLAVVRILFALEVLLFEIPRYAGLPGLPDSFFVPMPGLISFFRGFPPVWVVHLFNALLAFSAVGLLVGWRTGLMSAVLGVTFLIANGFDYAVGKIHHDLLLTLLPVLAGASGWGRHLSVDAHGRRRDGVGHDDAALPAWPMALLAMIVCLGMASSAFQKITAGWLYTGTQAVRGFVAERPLIRSRDIPVAEFLLTIDSRAFWELFDYGSVLIEFAFLPALLRLRWLRIVTIAGVVFHVSIFLATNIYFSYNFIAYAAFADWPAVIASRPARKMLDAWDAMVSRLRPWIVFLAGVAVAVLYVTLGDPLVIVLGVRNPYRYAVNLLALAFACLFAFHWFRRLKTPAPTTLAA